MAVDVRGAPLLLTGNVQAGGDHLLISATPSKARGAKGGPNLEGHEGGNHGSGVTRPTTARGEAACASGRPRAIGRLERKARGEGLVVPVTIGVEFAPNLGVVASIAAIQEGRYGCAEPFVQSL